MADIATLSELDHQLIGCLVVAGQGVDDADGGAAVALVALHLHHDVDGTAECGAASGAVTYIAAALPVVAHHDDRDAFHAGRCLERLHGPQGFA